MAKYWIEPDLQTIEMYELTHLSPQGLVLQANSGVFPDFKPSDALYYNDHNITVYTTVDDMLSLYGMVPEE